jgi:phosphomethylpyrimidine synthase
LEKKEISIANRKRKIAPLKIGPDTPTRIVVNIGLGANQKTTLKDIEIEMEKAKVAVKKGADIIADLSISKDVGLLRKRLLKELDVPISTVPLYDTCIETLKKGKKIFDFSRKDVIETIREHAEEGVDIITLHSALTKELLQLVKKDERVIPIPSRGGAFIACFMNRRHEENPLYEEFDDILEILREHRVTLSLGSALRPGSVADGFDSVYLREIMVQGELVRRARKKNVPTIVEGVGHMSIGVIPICIQIIKQICQNVPIRPMPISTDVGIGNDHVSGAIASAMAATYGADIICSITRCEHLGFPRVEDIAESVSAYKIAAHIADIAKNNDLAIDRQMSIARSKRKWREMWRLALDGEFACKLQKKLSNSVEEKSYCSMCGPLCALKLVAGENGTRRSKNRDDL